MRALRLVFSRGSVTFVHQRIEDRWYGDIPEVTHGTARKRSSTYDKLGKQTMEGFTSRQTKFRFDTEENRISLQVFSNEHTINIICVWFYEF